MRVRVTAGRALLAGTAAVLMLTGTAVAIAVHRSQRAHDSLAALPPVTPSGRGEPAEPEPTPSPSVPPSPPAPPAPTTAAPRPAKTAPRTAAAKTASPRPAPTRARPRPSAAPAAPPKPQPWFAGKVGRATQVVAVVGTGGSNATLSTWQKKGTTWTAVVGGVAAKVGARGISTAYSESSTVTPAGVFSLPSAFGRQADPGSGLPYLRVDNNDWWVSDVKSAAYNTHQRCAPGSCPFNEAAGENLGKAGPVYNYAVVMGVNTSRKPGAGSAFFLHVTNGKATAGCVAIASGTLTAVLRWLRPGAVIAVAPS